MATFKGQAEFSVDSKGRVAIPAKMRNALSPAAKGTFTMTRGFEKCVFLYPMDEWERIEEQIGGLNMYSRQSRDFVRTILMWADEVALDGQGRVSLTRPLMEFAGISEKVLIIGALDHIEIWDPETFGTYMGGQQDDYETLAERVMGQ
ncbi:MAG: division/cell wall cluster transcriptional repressor MraZ [Rhodothermales bacterium]|nr:division/cell wall cluster transcriptional repressor MraZ [Rhodothermales bacterium]MBO6778872.1 division/cell wall cluster transcriptional repressor MraZ [Rhodothermales bacterium]